MQQTAQQFATNHTRAGRPRCAENAARAGRTH
jgi:hypothetical protein